MAFLITKDFADKHIPMNYLNDSMYRKVVCSVCENQYYIFSAPMSCHICGEFACPACSKIVCINSSNCYRFMNIPKVSISTFTSKHVLECCIMCLTKIEIKNILQIPFNDLPLYINEEWVTPGAEEAYQARFSGETIKIPVGNKYIAIKCVNAPYFEFY